MRNFIITPVEAEELFTKSAGTRRKQEERLLFPGVLPFNKLNLISINTTLAKSKGIKTRKIDNIFAVLIAIVVMISIRWIGILLINSLLILPAASSRNIAKNMRWYHFYAIIFSLFSGIAGLILSYYFNIPTGPMIVIISGAIYFITLFTRKKLMTSMK